MKSSTIKKIGTLFLASALLFGCSVDNSETTDDNTTTDDSSGGQTSDDNTSTDDNTTDDSSSGGGETVDSYGAAGVDETKEYTVEQMMTFAIQDEYLAHEEYVQIIAAYGSAAPFSNIVKAEENHIDALTRLFETYKYDLPEDKAKDYVALPTTLLAAYQAGISAEKVNIAMYEFFLSQDLPDDVKVVFTSLQSASENHQAAFETQVAKYNT